MKQVIAFNVKSDFGAFNRPQSNNNPSSFYVIPKSAVIGLICAVIGIEREHMKSNDLYRVLSEKLKYSVVLRNPFRIKYWSEYSYNHGNAFKLDRENYTPSKSERLVHISYDICVMYDDSDSDLNKIVESFANNILNQDYVFPPYMGMANFMAELSFIGKYTPEHKNGKFLTPGMCTNISTVDEQPFEFIRTDEIPTSSKS